MNTQRLAVLTKIESEGELTSREIAETLSTTRRAISMLLLRARRDGLVVQGRCQGVHALSQRGRERLIWLRQKGRAK